MCSEVIKKLPIYDLLAPVTLNKMGCYQWYSSFMAWEQEGCKKHPLISYNNGYIDKISKMLMTVRKSFHCRIILKTKNVLNN